MSALPLMHDFQIPFRRKNLAFGALPAFVGDQPNVALRILADPPQYRDSDWPLVLYGPTGTGKTDLAFALLDDLGGVSSKPILQTAIDFARAYQSAVEMDTLGELRERYVRSDGWLIDDIHLIERYPSAQTELVHLIDQLLLRQIPLAMTSIHPIWQLKSLLPQLVSRLNQGLALPVNPPGKDARCAIIRYLARQRGLDFRPDAIEWLAERLSVTVPRIHQFFLQLDLTYLAKRSEPISVRSLQPLFEGSESNRPSGMIDRIILETARQYRLTPADLRSPSRKQTTSLARSVAVYLLRSLMNLSYAEIGRILGGRDHSTVMHAYKKIHSRIESKPVHDSVVHAVLRLQSTITEHISESIVYTR